MSSTITLTEAQIDSILSFIKPSEHIPRDSAVSVCELVKEGFRKQLRTQKIHASIIPALKRELEREYTKSLIDPGENIGIVCAQSIGEKNTQNTLNSFHKAGLAEKTVTTGVPRLKELLNASQEPKLVNNRIFFKRGNRTIQETRETMGTYFVNFTLGELCADIDIVESFKEEPWHTVHEALFSSDFRQHTKTCVRLKLKREKIFTYRITTRDVAERIQSIFPEYHCVPSPLHICVVDVFVDMTKIDKPTKKIGYVTKENYVEVCMQEVVYRNLKEFNIYGIPGIDECFFEKDEQDCDDANTEQTWMVEACGVYSKKSDCYIDILVHPDVDVYRTVSNNVWNIFSVFGIEAMREYLIQELSEIMDGVNQCHPMLLADRMTFSGTVESISRYTMRHDPEPFLRASFEETMDNFTNAAFFSEESKISGLASSLICGKRPSAGTGFFSTRINPSMLPEEDSDDGENLW